MSAKSFRIPVYNGFTSPFLPTPTEMANIRVMSRRGILPPDTFVLNRIITAAPFELARYDLPIQTLQRELDRLIDERNILASYASDCRSLLAPVRRLSDELLVEIFDLCRPWGLFEITENITPAQEAARVSQRHLLQLAEVCCNWHRVITGTPRLWSVITLDTSVWDQCLAPYHKIIGSLESSLRRGRDHHLTLRLAVSKDFHNKTLTRNVVNLLCSHAHRWRNVYIWSDDGPPQYLSLPSGKLGQLRILHLNVEWKSIDVFLEAPNLRELRFKGEVGNLPRLPWSQIQICQYTGNNTNHAQLPLSSLLLASNALEFTLCLDLREHVLPVAGDSTTSSHMETLTLHLAADDPNTTGRFFDALTLPSLKSFDIEPLDDTDPLPIFPSQSFLALANRSQFSTHLLRLKLHAILSDADLLLCLGSLPRLEELVIVEARLSDDEMDSMAVITDTLLRALLVVDGIAPLIPRLHYFDVTSRLEFSDSLFAAVVKARIAHLKRLDDSMIFDICLWWEHGEPFRELSGEFIDYLTDLASRDELLFSIAKLHTCVE
ncbi:hypothetical protein R3P38DRAFT_3003916 [Favolaschia claudopus]|uniref:F-box domain-containing protein n=1 Tax=Favolaschia claudopus TaxID=2862362 RepID=A0AAW0AKR1_9AGAR